MEPVAFRFVGSALEHGGEGVGLLCRKFAIKIPIRPASTGLLQHWRFGFEILITAGWAGTCNSGLV